MLTDDILEYTAQLKKGQIQRAYRGIIAFMSELKALLESRYSEYSTSTLYFGYMDMTYFAFTPPALKDRKLKVAIVYLHEEGRFELWLAAANRKIQADYIELLRHKELGGYTLSQRAPGVDAILSATVTEQPDFDHPEALKRLIKGKVAEFSKNIVDILA